MYKLPDVLIGLLHLMYVGQSITSVVYIPSKI